MRWFDLHAHLQDPRLAARGEEVVRRARAAGVRRVLCAGTREADWPEVSDQVRRHAGFALPAFGLHPMAAPGRTSEWEARLRERLDQWPRAAVGEIGLDRAVGPRDDADQESVFRVQLEISRERNRPVVVHSRRATERTLALMGECGPYPAGIVLHSFRGPVEAIAAFAALGAYFSFSGSVTRREAVRVHAAARAVPLERLLLETDAPFIPVAGPGEARAAAESEPADIVRVGEAVARIRGLAVGALARAAWANAAALFPGKGAGE